MAPVTNARLLFNEVLESGYPVPGKTFVYDTSQKIDLDKAPLNGGVLIKTLVLSNDPYMRGKMRSPEIKSYTSMYTVGKPLNNYGVGVVIRSEKHDIQPGVHLYGNFDFQEYTIQSDPVQFYGSSDFQEHAIGSDTPRFRVLENKEGLPWSLYVGVLGMPGKTAVFGWKEFAKPKKSDTLFVTTGAGQVGSLVIQLAKREGLKVIGSAGSDEKVKFMKDLGADVAFNYKKTKTRIMLEEAGGIDIYWDSVGGEMLDDALAAAKDFARFIECGMISGYNAQAHPIKNIEKVLVKSITMSGFIVMNLEEKYDKEFYATMPQMIAKGELKYKEDITKGLENAGEAIVAVQKGENMGKSTIVLADD